MRLKQYMNETTISGDVATNVKRTSTNIVSRRAVILQSTTGDDNLKVELIKTIDNVYQVVVYVLKDNSWARTEVYDFSREEKEGALDKYNQIVKEF